MMRAALLLLCLLAQVAVAQVRQIGSALPRPALGVDTVLSISVTPSNLQVTLVPGGIAYANVPIAITSTMQQLALTNVSVYAWLPSASAALTGTGGSVVPSTCVLGLVPTGVPRSYTPFTQTDPLGTTGATLRVVGLQNVLASHLETDNLYLAIDLTSLPQLPAGVYTGTLVLQAQAL